MRYDVWARALGVLLLGTSAWALEEKLADHDREHTVNPGKNPAAKTAIRDSGPLPALPPGPLLVGGLDDWKVYSASGFERGGEIEFQNDRLVISSGEPYSGVSIKTQFPRMNYEVSVEARRTEGNDIFCGLYFPIGSNACSMVLGGWGNYLSGLSMVDGMAASENDTGVPGSFRNNDWVHVRLRVTEDAIRVWTGETRIIHLEYKQHRMEPYPGLEVFEPFGLFTYQSSAEIRNLHVRPIYSGGDTDDESISKGDIF